MYCSKVMEMGSIYTVPCIVEKFPVLKVCGETRLLHLAENSHSMVEITNLIVRDNCPLPAVCPETETGGANTY